MTTDLSIALVSREYPPFYGGGIGTYARWIVPALASEGVRVHVVTQAYDRTQPRVEVKGTVTVHRIPVGMGTGGWPNAALRFSLQAAKLVASLYQSNRIQVAEFAECEAGALSTLVLNRDRPPTIVQLHTPSEQLFVLRSLSTQTLDVPHRVYFEAERLAMHLADEILAPSQFIADWAQQQYRFSRSPTVIPYATPPLPEPPATVEAGSDPVLFYAGRIEPRKGVESLILAFNEVSRRHAKVTLRLAGGDTSGAPDGGSMRAYLQTVIEPHARSRIHFLGRLNQDELSVEYARSHICVIPSLWENFPNTCIESMSSARAVLASDQGGMAEMIGDSKGGRTFVAGDPRDLARVMNEMLAEPQTNLIERGRIARSRIEHLCYPQRIARLRIQHFRHVIEKQAIKHVRPVQGTLSAWRGLEAALLGNTSSFDLPPVSHGVGRWVQQAEACPC